MKRIFSLIMGLVMLLNMAQAEEITYDFSASTPKGWTANPAPTGYEVSNYERGAQFQKSSTLTLSGSKGISKVVVTCSSNVGEDKNSISVFVNGTQFGKVEMLAKEALVNKTFEGPATDGDLVINIVNGKKSVWIKQVVVTCTEGANVGGDDGGNTGEGGETDDDEESLLDPNYEYGDSAKVVAPSDQFYNQPCTFVQNNIEVKCRKSTHLDGYFSCPAGEKITFTATQPILALAINGSVKKDFSATVDNGDIHFNYDPWEELAQDPIVYINNINEKSVTLSCDKQLRCKEVIVYFKEEPQLDFKELFGEDEDDPFARESTTPVTLTPAYDYAYAVEFNEEVSKDESIHYVTIYLYNEDEDQQMGLQFIADLDNFTGVPAGTYPIEASTNKGIVVASAGYDGFLDATSYVWTDVTSDDEGKQDWKSYYLASGTVTVGLADDPDFIRIAVAAKTHFGSTVDCVYLGSLDVYGNTDAIETIAADKAAGNQGKYFRNGQFCIERNGRKYNVLGVSVR